jgi:hypothetical protein
VATWRRGRIAMEAKAVAQKNLSHGETLDEVTSDGS